jgi:hypothetical protein
MFNLIKTVVRSRSRLLVLVLGLPLMLMAVGCATLPTGVGVSSPAIELTIRQVEPSGQPGIYRVTGSAALPDQSQVAVSAVRYLEDYADRPAEASPVYSILDRKFAEVTQGNWQTDLNLWQVAPDGEFREAWQLSQQEAGVALEPEPEVTFLVTLDPPNQPANLQEQIESQDESVQATLARFTTDGELYLQASKTLTVALPTGSTTPPTLPVRAARQSDRPQTAAVPNSDSTDSSPTSWTQTNAPLTPDQILR